MRRLVKRPLPPDLDAKLAKWQEQLEALIADGDPIPDALGAKYRYPPLKAVIVQETHGKCAYCESKVSHVYPGDVEHILPKKQFPQLRLTFDNLTLACFECNHAKGDHYDSGVELLNPYVDDPDDHLVACGTLVWSRFGDRRAETTERLLELNRKELVERRWERLESVRRMAEKYVSEPPGLLKDLLRVELEKEFGADAEYSFVVRAYISGHCDLAA